MGADPVVLAVSGQQEIFAAAGDRLSVRLPEPAEAELLGLGRWAGVPVISVRRSGESAEELYDSRRVRVVVK